MQLNCTDFVLSEKIEILYLCKALFFSYTYILTIEIMTDYSSKFARVLPDIAAKAQGDDLEHFAQFFTGKDHWYEKQGSR
ncbi:MAG: hypothetical protein Harvfovirus2_70 [Harvfovirus sp.]|uniref:Uncharacterized protein n=1 Tax=Harvfovirus sp. TaxID=2487768 RepID=A0A3G5A086_9VIRU|nr:MAG: hypothetical protein Harvfovirus2_70 [Harvfovirus sp.]